MRFELEHSEARTHVELAAALRTLQFDVQFALALRDSPPFRAQVLAGRPHLNVRLPLDAGWARISGADFVVGRERPDRDGAEVGFVELAALVQDQALASSPAGRRALDAADERARSLVFSLFFDKRHAFGQLAAWGPWVETSAYRVVACLAKVLDGMRGEVRTAIAEQRQGADALAVSYRGFAHALGRATLLATDAGAGWLAEMAKSFAWVHWTPSYVLSRERDRWSVAVGARAAARFGPTVIDEYLASLRRADHPLTALDAILGASAIGWAHPHERAALVAALEAEFRRLEGRSLVYSEVVAAGIAEAGRLLTGAGGPRDAAFSRLEDSFRLDARSRLPVFGLLPAAVDGAAWRFIPKEARQIPVRSARDAFRRAFVGGVDLGSLPSNAFGHA